MTKSSKPAGMTWLTPYLTVSDIDKMAHFYHKAFQFDIKELVKGEDGTHHYGELTCHDQMIMLGKQGAWGKTTKTPKDSGVESPIGLYLYCDNVDEFYNKALAAGAVSLDAPADMFWGDRMCRLQDPDGYSWSFATQANEQ